MNMTWEAIDPHVHCRDEEQSYKTTIREVLDLATLQGVKMVFDMPNPERPVIDRQRVFERLALVPKGMESRYKLYVGLTSNEDQILEALWCYDNIPEVIGFKMFAGRSVGDLSIISEENQRMVYRILTSKKFKGVLAVHCEYEKMMNPKIFKPENPISHTLARPEVAENASVSAQIFHALAVNFSGQLHICHVSSPISVQTVTWAKEIGLHVSCGLTPHHAMWDQSYMNRSDGLTFKMNPPLRNQKTVQKIKEQLLAGMIDIIETDHAPHSPEEKQPPLCLSGYPSLTLYLEFVTNFLPDLGLTEPQIKALSRDNVLKIFSDKL